MLTLQHLLSLIYQIVLDFRMEIFLSSLLFLIIQIYVYATKRYRLLILPFLVPIFLYSSLCISVFEDNTVYKYKNIELYSYHISDKQTINTIVYDNSAGDRMKFGLYNIWGYLIEQSEFTSLKNKIELPFPKHELQPGSYYLAMEKVGEEDFEERMQNRIISGKFEIVFGKLSDLGKFINVRLMEKQGIRKRVSPMMAHSTFEIVSGIKVNKTDYKVRGKNIVTQQPIAIGGEGDSLYIKSDNNWKKITLTGNEIRMNDIVDILMYNSSLFVLDKSFKIEQCKLKINTYACEDISPRKISHKNAAARPLAMSIFQESLFLGEYSNFPDEIFRDGGTKGSKARILRYSIADSDWSISGVFDARHAHSSFVESGQPSRLWWSFGDAGYGEDVGLSVLPADGVNKLADGDLDDWQRWTTYGGGNQADTTLTDNYSIDFIVVNNNKCGNLIDNGIYMSGDRPAHHLLYADLNENAKNRSIDTLYFHDIFRQGETTAALHMDEDCNLYYVTQENDMSRWYVSPPPYIDSKPFFVFENLFVGRVVSYDNELYLDNYTISPRDFASSHPNIKVIK